MNKTCAHCQSVLKPLFNVTMFCPNDCDRFLKPDCRWYSWYSCAQAPGAVYKNESYLTTVLETIKAKVNALGSGTRIWEVKLMDDAKVERVQGLAGVFSGGPVQLVGEVT